MRGHASASGASGSTGGGFDLLQNPFILLRVQPTATAQGIKHAYEDAVEDDIAAIDLLRRAQQELLTPRLRINAEVGGFLDVSHSLASQLTLRLRAGAIRTELNDLIARLHALPKSNVLAHLASQSSATIDDLMELIEAQATTTVSTAHEAISDAREAAGAAKVDSEAVAQALADLAERQVKAVIARATATDTFPKTFDACVTRVLASTDTALIAKLDLYVRAYSEAIAPALSLQREAVVTACAAVRSNFKDFASFERLLRALRGWNEIARPLRLFESHMNREEPQARELFMLVRELCIWLANEQQEYEPARIVTQYCAEIFKELPRALSQMQEEISTLSQLSAQKAAASLLEPLCKVLNEAQQSHRALEKDLFRNGFGPRSSGLVKKLYDEFIKAIGITASTEMADIPWRLVRGAAISLNNDSQSPGAATKLIDGLVSHFSVHRPSDDVVVGLKADQEAVRKSILQRDLVANLQQRRFSAAGALAQKLIEVEKDSQELEELKKIRDGIAARQRAKKIKLAWWAGAGVIALLVFIGNQEKGSGRSSQSTYSRPSTSSSPSVQTAYAEERPAIGTDLPFSQANLRYCTFQKIRLEAAQSFGKVDVERFNSFVDDWNSRCARYRYHAADKITVDSEARDQRVALEAQGRALLRRSDAAAR